MDGDGNPDIILPNSYNNNYITILRDIPSARFAVPKVTYIGNSIAFTDQSNKAVSWQWDFNEDSIFDSNEQNPVFTYTDEGVYNVKLRINNNTQFEKIISVTVLPNRGTPYTLFNGGNFETNAADFGADNIGVSVFSRGNSIQPGKSGTRSGSNAWVIDINSPEYSNNSTAYLYTPAFNCTAHGDYTLNFFAKYKIENTWDGFRVEYSTDHAKSWKILGDTVQTYWYDYVSPDTIHPFPEGEAYFSLNDAGAYQVKKFTTNIFQGNSWVAFRIVFKADPFVVEAGLAVDDFTLNGPKNIVLPISLLSFTGFNDHNKNILNWKVSSELNSSRYEIERSLDTHDFIKAGSMQSYNNSSGSTYQYKDDISQMTANKFYYRLKMIDKDGTYNFSTVISIDIRNKNEKIALLGNVTGSYINVITPAALLQKPLQVIITNLNGTMVKTMNISNTSSIIFVDKLAAGKYYARFIQDGKTIQTEPFIKQ
jgi:hypothetical protein